MHQKNRDFHEISTFLETCPEGSGKLLGRLGSVLECLRVSRNDFLVSIRSRKHVEMTRRAFLSSRVIQAQGKFDSKGLVKKWCKWVRKIKISQNP